jgi:hypothetical protein
MVDVLLSDESRDRLTRLVKLWTDAAGIARSRAVLRESGIKLARQSRPNSGSAVASVLLRILHGDSRHSAYLALARLAEEAWKTPTLDGRAARSFKKAKAALKAGKWDRHERELRRLAEIDREVPHPLMREASAALAIVSRKPERILAALRTDTTQGDVEPIEAVSREAVDDEAPVGDSVESAGGARHVAAPLPEPGDALSTTAVADDGPDLFEEAAVLVRRVVAAAGERCATPEECKDDWYPRIRATWDAVSEVDELGDLPARIRELEEAAAVARERIEEVIAADAGRRREAQRLLKHHCSSQTPVALLARLEELKVGSRDAPGVRAAMETHLAEVETAGFATVVARLEAALAEHLELRDAARIRELQAELAELQSGRHLAMPSEKQPPIAAPEPPPQADESFSETVEVLAVASLGFREAGLLEGFPSDDGYLKTSSVILAHPVGAFLPLPDGPHGIAPASCSNSEAATTAAAWILHTAKQIVSQGRRAPVETTSRLLFDLAAVVRATGSGSLPVTLLQSTLGLLALASSRFSPRRRKHEAKTLVQLGRIDDVNRRFALLMKTLVRTQTLGTFLARTIEAGMDELLIQLTLGLEKESRTTARAWSESLGVALASLPRQSREATWERICDVADLEPSERDSLDEWLSLQERRPRSPRAGQILPGPPWFVDVAERMGRCIYESDEGGTAGIRVSIVKAAGRAGRAADSSGQGDGIYIAEGQDWARVPLLISNTGKAGAGGIEVTLSSGSRSVELREDDRRIHARWLSASGVSDASKVLVEVQLKLASGPREKKKPIVLKWRASWDKGRTEKEGSLNVSWTRTSPQPLSLKIPQAGVRGEPLDLHKQQLLERSSQSVKDCFTELRDKLRAGTPVRAMVYGRRRRGKSSICRSLELDDRIRNQFVIQASTWNAARMTSLAAAYEHLAKLIARAAQERGETVRPFVAPHSGHREDLFPAWEDWLRELAADLKKPVRVLLLLDEFQRWVAGHSDVRDRREVLSALRGFNDTIGGRLEVSFVLFGLRNLKRYREEALDFAGAVQPYELRPFNGAEARIYVRECLPHEHDDRVSRRLYRLSGGNPFVLNLLCFAVAKAVNEDQRAYCLPADVDRLLDGLDERIEMVFRYMLREDEEEEAKTLPQVTVLRAVASLLWDLGDPGGSVSCAEVEEWLTGRVEFDEGLPLEHLRELVGLGVLERGRSDRFSLPGEAICAWLASKEPSQVPLRPVTRRIDVDLVLGRYKQLKELPAGGQARVWLAENVEEGNNRVVLKLYAGVGEETRERIEQEGQALNRISSRYVVRCLGYRVDERKGGVVVMEHVDGLSLDVLLKERPNSAQRILPGCKDPSEPVALLSKLAEAVRAVHRADVVHKDLKPANIMMTEEGGVWEPKVIDFGLAAPEMPDGRSGNTHSIWTWRYLAPEKKSDEDATRRRPADIYSLGVVFLEILVGLSKMDPSKLLESKRAALAPKMVVLLQAMLSIEPDDRPTIDEVVGRLQGVLEPEDWRQAGERADEEYSEERFDQALMFYHRALAEAPPGERRTSGFAALLPNVLDCITDATEVPGWWRLLARVSVNAREHLGQSYWEDLFKEAKGAPDGKTEGVSPLGEVLEVLEDTIPQWDKAAEPMALGLATVSLPVRESELLYQLLLAARDCEEIGRASCRERVWLKV